MAETLQEFLSDYYSNHRKANSEWTGLLDRSALVNVYANLASNPEKAVDVLETAMQDANISSINPATSARAKRALLCYEAISNFIHDLVDNNSQLEQVDGILNGGRAAIESLQRIIRTTPDGDFGPGSSQP
ncbi:MAG: hypothetical protein R3A13_07590 [Bdellovibrionota bacterium]